MHLPMCTSLVLFMCSHGLSGVQASTEEVIYCMHQGCWGLKRRTSAGDTPGADVPAREARRAVARNDVPAGKDRKDQLAAA